MNGTPDAFLDELPFTDPPEVPDEETAEELGAIESDQGRGLLEQTYPVLTPQRIAAQFFTGYVSRADDERAVISPWLREREGITLSDEQAVIEIAPWERIDLRRIEKDRQPRTDLFKLPPQIVEILRAAGDDISSRKWIAARTIQAYLSDMQEQKANALRADVIKQSASALQTDETVVREWLHTAEMFPDGAEEDPRFIGWGFSLFARAARMGEPLLALYVLEIAHEQQGRFNPGAPPPCWIVNQIVKEQKARLRGATDEELDALRAEADARVHLRFSARVIQLVSIERPVVIVPEDSDIMPGDEVVVFRKASRE